MQSAIANQLPEAVQAKARKTLVEAYTQRSPYNGTSIIPATGVQPALVVEAVLHGTDVAGRVENLDVHADSVARTTRTSRVLGIRAHVSENATVIGCPSGAINGSARRERSAWTVIYKGTT